MPRVLVMPTMLLVRTVLRRYAVLAVVLVLPAVLVVLTVRGGRVVVFGVLVGRGVWPADLTHGVSSAVRCRSAESGACCSDPATTGNTIPYGGIPASPDSMECSLREGERMRIHFTAADLTRVSFPAEPEPLWETALAARALGNQPSPAHNGAPDARVGGPGGWSGLGGRRFRRVARGRLRPSMRPLFKLIAPTGQFPDFLTPEVPAPGLDAAVELLMDTPADLIRDTLGPWLPAEVDDYMRGLLAGKAVSRRALGTAVREFHQLVLTPSAGKLGLRHSADLALRSRALLHGGVEELLGGLHPGITWNAPILTTAGPTREIHLAGRGLLLYPSPLTADFLTLDVPERRPVLVYPCADLPPESDPDPTTDALADLLGRTRAAVLRSLTTAASTTQVARRTGISLASASEHTTVLRNAGLITTHRPAGTTLHSLTPAAYPLLTSPRSIPAIHKL